MTRAVAYIRLSPTASDREELDRRLDVQRSDIEEHAGQNGKTIEDEFVARRVSGRKDPPQCRDVFREMTDYLRDNDDVGEVIVQHKDRLTRQPGPQVAVLHILETMVGREIDVYSVKEDRYVSRFESLGDDEEMLGRFFATAAEAASSDIEKNKENQKIQDSLDSKEDSWKPTGKPPRAINSNRVVFGEQQSSYYCPLPDAYIAAEKDDHQQAREPRKYDLTDPSNFGEFAKAISVLRVYWQHDGRISEYKLGKMIGYDQNPGNTAKGIINNAWKYWQAYRVMQERDEYTDPSGIDAGPIPENVPADVTEPIEST